MAELRDPTETGPHVNRVASYSIEIYQQLASKWGIPEDMTMDFRGDFRIGAMLHDVGKVAISDTILKKPGRLTDEERAAMQLHTIYGAHLFRARTSKLDVMSAEIAANHHEKWDGTGYPGYFRKTGPEAFVLGEGKQTSKIPLTGRIVALADVYDALISPRCYKDPFPEQKVLDIIKSDTGSHFDPEVSEAFFEIYDVIKAIREKYKDKPLPPKK